MGRHNDCLYLDEIFPKGIASKIMQCIIQKIPSSRPCCGFFLKWTKWGTLDEISNGRTIIDISRYVNIRAEVNSQINLDVIYNISRNTWKYIIRHQDKT